MKRASFMVLGLVCASLLVVGGAATAQTDFGSGNGCSAVGGVDATTIVPGDTFQGRIGATGATDQNKNGGAADDGDADGFTDSLEGRINDSLVGFCNDVDRNDAGCIQVTNVTPTGKNGNKATFQVTFGGTCGGGTNDGSACFGGSDCPDDVPVCTANVFVGGSTPGDGCVDAGDCGTDVGACEVNPTCCGTSQCSDQADNDVDSQIDFPDDPECVDYRDDDETNL